MESLTFSVIVPQALDSSISLAGSGAKFPTLVEIPRLAKGEEYAVATGAEEYGTADRAKGISS